MKVKCPRCGSFFETGKAAAGSGVTCACGNVVSVPKKFPVWLLIGLIGAAGCIPCTGILAGIAVPNFIRFQAKAKQAECKANLKSLYVAQQSLFAQQNTYAPDLVAVGFSPEPGNRYAYLTSLEGKFVDRASTSEVRSAAGILPDSARETVTSLDEATVRLAARGLEVGLQGTCPDCSLTMACIGNIDGDDTLDVWTISTEDRTTGDGEPIPAGTPFQHVDDVVE